MTPKPERAKPRKNDVLELAIHDLHANGFGVGKCDGFAFFVEGALPGDRLRIQVLKVKSRYAYGKTLEILSPSPHRLPEGAACPVTARCGGCQFQHADYACQLAFKEKAVREALVRIGGIADPPVQAIVGAENPFHYRNKAQFPAGIGPDGSFVMGFYSARSHRIVPVTECNIQRPACNAVLAAVRRAMAQYPIPPYDEATHTGLLRHVLAKTGENGETMAVLVLNGGELPHAQDWVKILSEAASTVLLNTHTAQTNAVLGPVYKTLYGSGYIHGQIGAVRYRISAASFFQVNPAQTKLLYDHVRAHLATPVDTIVDAHTGIGGMALYVADLARQVIGIETVQQAVHDAKHNAALNGISNARFLCGTAEEVLPALLRDGRVDVLLLDPPRKGCSDTLLDAALAAGIPKIIYVSCDPATLARDVQRLCAAGDYRLAQVQPVDMFPMTGHVECVALLWKNRIFN